MKIGIIGTGVFSAAIAYNLAQNTNNKIVMWSENKDLVNDYKKTNKMESIYKGKEFPKNVTLTNSYDTLLKDVELVIIMTSISYVETVTSAIKETINKDIPICIGTKGTVLYNEKQKFAYEIVHHILKNPIAILSGPTYAEDVISLDPVAFNVACKGKKIKNVLLRAFDLKNVKIVFTSDFKGVSICGTVKNIYAIGSGILTGLGYKESTIAYYLTSVYKELETILYMYESSLTTLHSLAGFGDLIATCSSTKSRNYNFGLLLGKKESKKELNDYKEKNTIEGLISLEHCTALFAKKHIKTPLLTVLNKIVNGEEEAKALLNVMEDMKLNSIY